jgi:ABC-type multidrug transport system ATPase subunit
LVSRRRPHGARGVWRWLLRGRRLRSLREALRAAAAQGAGVLVATQDLSFAERVCDDVVLLSEGRVVGRGGVQELSPLEDTFLTAVGAAARVGEVRRALRDL